MELKFHPSNNQYAENTYKIRKTHTSFAMGTVDRLLLECLNDTYYWMRLEIHYTITIAVYLQLVIG